MHPDAEHGLRVQLAAALRERDMANARANAQMAAVLYTIGGEVEGHPTSAINYLQRLRALVAIEKAFADAGPMVASAKYMVEKARDCERAEEALAAARRECDRLRGVLTEIVDHGGANRGIWSQSQAKAALAAPADGEETKR